ncbi:hypothetical protein HN51_019627 [Arachis hypogaea]
MFLYGSFSYSSLILVDSVVNLSTVIFCCVTIQSSHHKDSFRLSLKAQHHHSIWCRRHSCRRKEAPSPAARLQPRPGTLVRSDADVAIEEVSNCFRFVTETKEV